tara:strand:- start:2557 stop:4284 length:1728 start_codon:yes stop_codon:yes gene_type:complete
LVEKTLANEKKISAGEFLFREGETAEFAYVLKSGSMDLVKSGLDGDLVLASLETGALFGEMALIDGSPRSASAKATEDCVVTEVRSDAFEQYIRSKPDAAVRIMKNLSTQLRAANTELSHRNLIDSDIENQADISDQLKDNSEEEVLDTDAIYDKKPSKLLMYYVFLILFAIVTTVIFGFVGQVDTTISSRGKLTTKAPNVIVQASGSAVIDAVLVERGEHIKAGQVVAILNDTFTKTNFKSNTEKISAASGRLQRYTLEKKYVQSGKKLNKDLPIDSSNYEILSKHIIQYRSKDRSLSTKILRLQQEITATKKNLEISKEQLMLKEKLEAVQENLYNQKIGSLLKYLSAQDASLNAKLAYLSSQNTLKRFQSELTGLIADKRAFRAQWLSQLSEQIANEKESISQLKQEEIKLKKQFDNVEIRAPVEGIVLDTPVVTQGSIVSEGDEVLTLVRTNQPLALEVDVDPKEISKMTLGLPVSVKLDAFPFQEYGDLKGELVFISKDTFSQSLDGAKGTFYRARVQILPDQLTLKKSDFRLDQGMLASADIKVGKRKIITYFTHPITKGFSKAFTEPN